MECKHEIDATQVTPGELWVACLRLDDDQFPCRVQFEKEAAILRSSDEASLFGLGAHFGSLTHDRNLT